LPGRGFPGRRTELDQGRSALWARGPGAHSRHMASVERPNRPENNGGSRLDEERGHRGSKTGSARPLRVLVEIPDVPEGTVLWRELTGLGFEVSWCPGPEGPPASWCPLMGGRACDLVDSADVVISSLGFDSSGCREVLAKIRSLHPGARVIVEVNETEAVTWASLVDGYQVIRRPVTAQALSDAIERATGVALTK
jgi:hypothetical protein